MKKPLQVISSLSRFLICMHGKPKKSSHDTSQEAQGRHLFLLALSLPVEACNIMTRLLVIYLWWSCFPLSGKVPSLCVKVTHKKAARQLALVSPTLGGYGSTSEIDSGIAYPSWAKWRAKKQTTLGERGNGKSGVGCWLSALPMAGSLGDLPELSPECGHDVLGPKVSPFWSFCS